MNNQKIVIILTPQFIVVSAAFCFTTAVPHLTAVLLIVYPKTELLPLKYTKVNKAKASVNNQLHKLTRKCTANS